MSGDATVTARIIRALERGPLYEGDALAASRSKAIAALGKAYIRREETPDDDLFRALIHSMGVDDDVAISFLLHAWAILRAYAAHPAAPGNPQAGRTKRRRNVEADMTATELAAGVVPTIIGIAEQRTEAPGEQASAGPKMMSPAQRALIVKMCSERNVEPPDEAKQYTFEAASAVIDSLKAGTYNPDEHTVPF